MRQAAGSISITSGNNICCQTVDLESTPTPTGWVTAPPISTKISFRSLLSKLKWLLLLLLLLLLMWLLLLPLLLLLLPSVCNLVPHNGNDHNNFCTIYYVALANEINFLTMPQFVANKLWRLHANISIDCNWNWLASEKVKHFDREFT